MPHILAVEGSIGAGKSTLLPKLAEVLGFEFLLEPVDTDGEFKRLLGVFMNNPKCVHARNDFQMYITNQRADMLKDIDPNGKYLIERSLLSDLVFTHACMANYEDTPEDAAHHMDCYKHLIARLQDYPTINTCLYLKTDPVVAYSRVMNRGREEEKFMPMSYMRDLSAFHDAVLPQACRKAGTRLIVIDWNTFKDPELVVREMCAQGFRV